MRLMNTAKLDPEPARQQDKTLADLAFSRVREDLLAGYLAPGVRLKLSELQKRYDLGLSPLREALMRLAAEDLVVAEGQRGFTVASMSLDELRDLTRTRERIEALALADAMEKGDADWEAEILASYHRLVRAPLPQQGDGDPVAMVQWEAKHRAFHRSLVAACGSPWLLRFLQQLAEHSERYRRVRMLHSPPSEPLAYNVEKEHEDIMQAVLARDLGRASSLMSAHLRRTAATVEAYWAPGSGR